MIPLERSFQMFTYLCICPTEPSTKRWIKIRNISIAIVTMLALCTSNIASMVFVKNNIFTDLPDALYGVLQVAPLTAVIYTFAMAYVLRDDIQNVFVAYQQFYDFSKELNFFLLLGVPSSDLQQLLIIIIQIFKIFFGYGFRQRE